MSDGPGEVLPIPSSFPVEWANDEEAKMLWVWDDVHTPVPATPMQRAINAVTGRGIRQAARELQMPRGGPRRDFNGYAYIAYLPTPPAREEVERYDLVLDRAIPALRQRWDQEFLPKLERDLATMRGYDVKPADAATLARYLRQALELHQTHYYIHFMVIFTLFGATARLARIYQRITGSSDEMGPYRLLQGIPNISVEAGKALSAIAADARSNAEVAALFETSDPHSILRRLRRTPAAEAILARLQTYLETYGNRSVAEDISGPTWLEDPSYPILALRGYVRGAPRDFDAELSAQATEAERATQEVLASNPAHDKTLRRELLQILEHCRASWPLREDHAHYIDQQSVALIRQLLLAAGMRLVDLGVIDRRDDVFYLDLPEAQQALETGTGRLQGAVEERQAARREFMRTPPPQFMGTMPAAGPALDTELAKFFNPLGTASSPVGEQARTLRGLAGSPGLYTGPARVILTPEEFDRVQPGDVLVTRTTNPSWTPLFGAIGALVTDSGGVLSHGAIVAREVGLPAVMGTKAATTRIKDGQIVTVDGNTGVVRLGE